MTVDFEIPRTIQSLIRSSESQQNRKARKAVLVEPRRGFIRKPMAIACVGLLPLLAPGCSRSPNSIFEDVFNQPKPADVAIVDAGTHFIFMRVCMDLISIAGDRDAVESLLRPMDMKPIEHDLDSSRLSPPSWWDPRRLGDADSVESYIRHIKTSPTSDPNYDPTAIIHVNKDHTKIYAYIMYH